jgi:ribonuclease HI
MTRITIYFDGLCKPKNPGGKACFGVFMTIQGDKNISLKGVIGTGAKMSNNVAEYEALYQSLCFLLTRRTNSDDVLICGIVNLSLNK